MKEKHIEDLAEIKDIMKRSTRFTSLSGLTGIFSGLFALIAGVIAYQLVFRDSSYLVFDKVLIETSEILRILAIGFATVVIAFAALIFFTIQQAEKEQKNYKSALVGRTLINLLIPMLVGGVICLTLLFRGYPGMVFPLTLIFYGLGLLSASKHTLSEMRSLGFIQIILGLLAFQLVEYGLFFWMTGFGLVHIIYGVYVKIKYK